MNPGTVLAVDNEATLLQIQMVDSKSDGTAHTSIAPEPKVADNEEIINRIRNGWTIEDAHAVSVGELYLMVCTLIIPSELYAVKCGGCSLIEHTYLLHEYFAL